MRLIIIFIAFLSSILVPLFVVQAECTLSTTDAVSFLQDCANDPVNAVSNQGNTGTAGVKELVQSVAEKFIAFGALFAVGALVFAGIRYTTSYGDDEKIKHAKSTGIYALIGLLILGLAFPFVDTIVTFIYNLGG